MGHGGPTVTVQCTDTAKKKDERSRLFAHVGQHCCVTWTVLRLVIDNACAAMAYTNTHAYMVLCCL